MLLEYVATDASVEGIFVTAVTIVTVVAMVLGYWNRAMLVASLKRENEALRGTVEYRTRKIENLIARAKKLEPFAAEEMKRLNYGPVSDDY